MVDVDLRQMELGSPAAERDAGLQDYFIESDAFRRVAEGNKRIVIGNRGVGKSAIFQFIARTERKKPLTSVIELSPEDYSYELLRETMATEQEGSWQKQSAYAAAWKYLLYVLVMKEVTKDGGKPARGSALGRISKYVRDHHQGGQHDKLSALISYLKRLEGVKIGKYEGGLKTRELQKLYKLEELVLLLPDLQEVLQRQRVIILVDELDKGWDESEDAKAFVAGLFQACQALNSVSTNMRLYMSLRQELYENIPALYEDAQKVRDLTETIRWDEAGLKRLVARRIRVALLQGKSFDDATEVAGMSDDDLWNALFAETLTYRRNNSFNYLVDRTLYRPREIIQFCSQVIGQATDEERDAPLDYATIVKAEHTYSEDRAQDIAAEYRFQYPELLVIFEEFRGQTYTFDREELELLCLEIILRNRPSSSQLNWLEGFGPDELIDVLWRVGFLKAQAVGGIKGQARSGSTYLGPYQVGSLNMPSITRFQVHPMYRSWLAMREPKGTPNREAESQR
ncbi:hypothetical protein [Curtobacterium sp. MMLR14_010]|uniref:P-loop ATPase, Sll1717 family n=1 Tax=Curtobacterium sp. MMLR14_010 TaxID=1898743 RepID=UPI001C316F4F|nr:hypothetical protein [Curtobacterium sp. MMLR14_010]